MISDKERLSLHPVRESAKFVRTHQRQKHTENMDANKQRIAIAKACHTLHRINGRWRYMDKDSWWDDCINNDPLTDLNACHEMEKVLTQKQYWGTTTENGYIYHLIQITELGRAYSATAAQRCEAFLKTLSLWTE